MKYICCGRHRRYTLFLFFLFGILSSSSFYHSSFHTYQQLILHSSYQRLQQTFSFRKDIIEEQSLGLFHLKKKNEDSSSGLTLKEWNKFQNKVYAARQSSLNVWPQPIELECPSIHSLKNDWVMCLPTSSRQSCLIYSSGKIQHDTNFTLEEELVQLTTRHPYYNDKPCEIHVFDPDYDPRISHPKIQFHDWGWWNGEEGTEMDAKFQTIQQSVTTLHHTHQIVNFLFLDCETCELDIYQDIVSDDTITFLQIVVHIHKTTSNEEILQHFFKTMKDHHYVIFYQKTIHDSIDKEESIYGFLKLHPSFFY